MDSPPQPVLDLAESKSQKTTVSVDDKTADSVEGRHNCSNPQAHWHPGVRARFPWIGFVAVCSILLCIAFTIIILVTSNGKAQETWPAYQQWRWINAKWKRKIQLTPSTALATVNTVSNLALAIAIGNGVAIAWWRRALKGSTVKDLHKSWAFSSSVLQLLTAGKRFNLIALCALTAKFALVDNVLLQRAASSEPGSFQQKVDKLRLPIVPELPSSYTGVFSKDGNTGYLSAAFSANLYNYYTSSQAISFDELWDTSQISTQFDTQCVGACDLVVPGFGFNVTCSEDTLQNYNVTVAGAAKNVFTFDNSTSDTNSTGSSGSTIDTLVNIWSAPVAAGDNFTIGDAEVISYPEPWILLTVDFAKTTTDTTASDNTSDANGNLISSTSQNCAGVLHRHTCSLRPAVVNYPIRITNYSLESHAANGILLLTPVPGSPLTELGTPGREALKNGQIWDVNVNRSAYQQNPSDFDSNIIAIQSVLRSSFHTSATLEYLNDTGFITHAQLGSVGLWWATSQSSTTFPDSCAIQVFDPTVWLVTQINNIMLRASISAAVYHGSDANLQNNKAINSSILNNLSGKQRTDTIVYKSAYSFMAGAISVMFLCILCVLPSYYGFWELGRKVTLGPMEIASAFQAPVLDHPVGPGGDEVDTLLKEVGGRKVKYGEIEGTGRIAMADPTEVRGVVNLRVDTA